VTPPSALLLVLPLRPPLHSPALPLSFSSVARSMLMYAASLDSCGV
jgi:hypothetical protein